MNVKAENRDTHERNRLHLVGVLQDSQIALRFQGGLENGLSHCNAQHNEQFKHQNAWSRSSVCERPIN